MAQAINRGTKSVPKRVHTVNYHGSEYFASLPVFGCGNPKTTGATRGERRIVAIRNVSKFTVAGTAHLVTK